MVNGKIYIGQTIGTLHDRWRAHKSKAKKPTTFIYSAMNKYGVENFKIEELCKVNNLDELNELEEFLIQEFNSTNDKIGYNIRPGGKNQSGFNHTDITKEKISKSRIGIVFSDEHRKNLSIACLNKPTCSEETKAKRRINGKNRVFSAETKAKISASKLGKPRSAETIAKISETLTGRSGHKSTPEINAKISATNKLRWKERKEKLNII